MHACACIRWPQQDLSLSCFVYITFTFFIDLCVSVCEVAR